MVSQMTKFDKLLRQLEDMASGSNTTCRALIPLLEELGFVIEDCGSAGHKIARHTAVSLREYPDFNCGHNNGKPVKAVYMSKLKKFVKTHASEIKESMQ